ncbi:hypothetical protein [Vibrio cholerae]|uniref:Uncharacterized protein n=1 Tax=Vibrio cholerae TaxID=666 RepID=A0ABD7SSH2_VIBCL|nr:hypothetical protein [Vibrio cholerae]EGR4074138.1 hypothetical protein [Vibrio cholerae]MBY4642028.1 hypothetical protein [Vibrio cholerae]MCR9658300.1 hypothetical protein [Vibrio cholerae]MCR9688981.1 hypothetical protein [Vibrio cholerae]MCR9737489.1 hypothetical protein [Vibrio cholerae]
MYKGAYGVSVKDGERHVDVFAPLDITHGIYIGKLHLSIPESSRVFCGSNKALHQINAADLEWVTQADPEGQLCMRCKNAAVEYLKKVANKSS